MNTLELNQKLAKINEQIKQSEELIKTEKDSELIQLAKQEIEELERQKINLEEQINKLSEEKSNDKVKSVIIEIRAGTGGDEAALFAADLFRMYSRFAERKGWKSSVIDKNKTSLRGYKEIIFEISNNDVYSKLQQESGVHRVQRIPETEKSGRVHTSTATVAVLPQAKKSQIKINPKEFRIDVYRSSGPGGQYVNKRDSAVRVTHVPTGIVTTSQQERTQLANRETALKVMYSKLYSLQLEKELKKQGAERREQIGTGERSEKIRTYNFPQDRITDHRIKKNWHNIESIMDGNLDPIVKAFQSKNK